MLPQGSIWSQILGAIQRLHRSISTEWSMPEFFLCHAVESPVWPQWSNFISGECHFGTVAHGSHHCFGGQSSRMCPQPVTWQRSEIGRHTARGVSWWAAEDQLWCKVESCDICQLGWDASCHIIEIWFDSPAIKLEKIGDGIVFVSIGA